MYAAANSFAFHHMPKKKLCRIVFESIFFFFFFGIEHIVCIQNSDKRKSRSNHPQWYFHCMLITSSIHFGMMTGRQSFRLSAHQFIFWHQIDLFVIDTHMSITSMLNICFVHKNLARIYCSKVWVCDVRVSLNCL